MRKGFFARFQKKQRRPFPFELITAWVRPYHGDPTDCFFCQKPVTSILHGYIENPAMDTDKETVSSGLVDMDAIWRRAIERQRLGNYQERYRQLLCGDCMRLFVSIQLGNAEVLTLLLSQAEIARRQYGVKFSQVICCTVHSLDDEGDTWAMNTYHTDIASVVEVVQSAKPRVNVKPPTKGKEES